MVTFVIIEIFLIEYETSHILVPTRVAGASDEDEWWPAEKGGKVVLKNVFFDTNLFNLKSESYPELDKLVLFMKGSSTVSVEVSGHTDSTGDKKKNQQLSENRAKAVYDYLISKGVPAPRLTFKGYGDSMPVAGNDTEEGRAQNRRTEFLITGVL